MLGDHSAKKFEPLWAIVATWKCYFYITDGWSVYPGFIESIMKILIYSPFFYPSIGGLETIIATLAHELTALGHEIKLVSQTPAKDSKRFSFEVIRQPKKKQL